MKNPLTHFFSLTAVLLIVGFGGWKGYKKLNLPGFQLIPSGELITNFKSNEKQKIETFFMHEAEVTNIAYREFLAGLKADNRLEDLAKAQINPKGWNNEPFEKTYHIHSAYDDYPVVNVSHEGAQLYCKWLEGKLQSLNEGRYEIQISLPSKAQWMYAAYGGNQFAPYPWGTHYIRNKDGLILANFRRLGDESIRRNEETGELEVINLERPDLNKAQLRTIHMMAPSTSYLPNPYGLYNMSGNVAEMLSQAKHAKGGSWSSTGYDIRIDALHWFSSNSKSHETLNQVLLTIHLHNIFRL